MTINQSIKKYNVIYSDIVHYIGNMLYAKHKVKGTDNAGIHAIVDEYNQERGTHIYISKEVPYHFKYLCDVGVGVQQFGRRIEIEDREELIEYATKKGINIAKTSNNTIEQATQDYIRYREGGGHFPSYFLKQLKIKMEANDATSNN